jgi:hypothetical protein
MGADKLATYLRCLPPFFTILASWFLPAFLFERPKKSLTSIFRAPGFFKISPSHFLAGQELDFKNGNDFSSNLT